MSKWCNTCHRNELPDEWTSCDNECPVFGKSFDDLAKAVIKNEMMHLYAYDNLDGDKGIIIAESYLKAVELWQKMYPNRKLADRYKEGTFLDEVDYVTENTLYITHPA